jgi:hypothetical protein
MPLHRRRRGLAYLYASVNRYLRPFLRPSQFAKTINESTVSGIDIRKKTQIEVFWEEISFTFIPSKDDTNESGMKKVARVVSDLFAREVVSILQWEYPV